MRFTDYARKAVTRLRNGTADFPDLSQKLDVQNALLGKLVAAQIKGQGPVSRLEDVEFRVFSQFGDDGIIQYLIHHADLRSDTFVEFGVENFQEANTRFLLVNNNWRGLVMDCSDAFVETIRSDSAFWRHDLTAVSAFITRENINDFLEQNGFAGELGILSIDIDGNDYWVWEAIRVSDPTIVIVEYNSVFGARHAITIPYDETFNRTAAHYSNLYWGTSLKALDYLAGKKGYAFVGSNSHGNNAYFVRRDRLGSLQAVSVEQGYVESRFRESRDRQGKLTYLAGRERLEAIREMTVVDVVRNLQVRIADLD